MDELRITLYLPNFEVSHGSTQTGKAPSLAEIEGDEKDFDVSFDIGADQTDYVDFFV